jgi:23S rRNA pseudoU1915 N3-methylase RlmH
MAKMTMHQELDMLRAEVEELRKQKEERERIERAEAIKAEEAEQQEIEEAKEKAEEIMESLEEGKMDAKETLSQLLDTIKKDYENLSPTSAILLFALGAAFGHALSSK